MSVKRPDKFVCRWAKRLRAYNDLGGECNRCGETDIFKLHFHHVDPTKKEFQISKITAHVPWPIIKQEIDKCVLLCANCHTSLHSEDSRKKFELLYDKILEKSKVVEKISRPELDSDYIYKLLKEKKSIATIGKILGKDPSTILDIAERLQDKYGEKLFLTREEYNKDKQKVDQDELISLVRNGESVKNIAKKFDSAQSTVYNLIRKLKRKQKL